MKSKLASKQSWLRCFVCFAAGQVPGKKIYRVRLMRDYTNTHTHTQTYKHIHTNMNIQLMKIYTEGLMRKERWINLAEVISTRLLTGEITMISIVNTIHPMVSC